MTSKDIWGSLSKAEKKQQIESTLAQLYLIQEGKHSLSGTREQGRLAKVKKDLEEFLINAAQWQSDK